MRRVGKDYEDKQMASRTPSQPGPAPAGGTAPAPAGKPVDVRPSEREAVEAAREGKPRPSEAEAAEERAKAMEEAEEEAEQAP